MPQPHNQTKHQLHTHSTYMHPPPHTHTAACAQVRDMVGKNPIVLVGTKMDLLPPGARPKQVADWLMEAALRKRLNITSTHLVSSHTGEGE